MKQQGFSAQTTLIWLAFALACLIRFVGLGTSPLNDREAELALQALQIAQGKSAVIQAYPLEVITSAGLFFLFGSSNFLARFLSALSGSLLILAVISLRRQLGTPFTLVLAFALALDPALVAQSRQMGSAMPALAALAGAYLFWCQTRWQATGIALGLAILSGPAFWYGGVILLLTTLSLNALKKRLFPAEDRSLSPIIPLPPSKEALSKVTVATVLTLIFASTLFLFYPRGLAASVSPLLTYLAGWTATATVSIFQLLLGLAVYQPLAILFGAIAVVRSLLSRQPSDLPVDQRWEFFLSLWFAIAFVLALLYPARQLEQSIWFILPLWVFAAQEISRWVETWTEPVWAAPLLGGITFVFLSLFWLQWAAYSSLVAYGLSDWLRVASVFSSLALIALIIWLAEMVLPVRVAWQGLIFGTLSAFLLYTVSIVWGVAFSHPWSQVFRQELWKPYPQIGDADLVLKTVHDLSTWKSGRRDSVPIVLAVDSPALQWLLRHQTQLTVLPQDQALSLLSVRQTAQLPAILITPAMTEMPTLAATYRGQDFNWRYQPNWQGIPPFPLQWLLFRQGSWNIEPIILWARSDLFPDSQSRNINQGAPPLEIPFEEEFPLDQP